MKKMKNDNKGFTLVELIVVLVILAILAAILVPALLGYIDEAKQKQIVLEGKSVYTAAQACASEMYAKDQDPSTMTDAMKTRILTMADVLDKCTACEIGFEASYTKGNHKSYTVNYVKYSVGTATNETIYLSSGTWSSDAATGANTVTIK